MNKLLAYNLQFFAEDTEPEIETETEPEVEDTEIDASAFADLISEKDKRIESLEKDIANLKKSNAEMLVRMNASSRETTKDIGEVIVDFCDTRKVK